jgi:MFS-type transporter involved in bile tolerance (Atg22 family)
MTQAVKQVLTVRDVWLVAGCYFFFLAGYSGFTVSISFFAQERGMALANIGLMSLGMTWATLLGTLWLPALSDRVGFRKVFYCSSMLLAGIVVILTGYDLGLPLWSVTIIWGGR